MKLLYLLHTDWNWIKQRSQFLAENLNDMGYEVTVSYKYSFKRLSLVKNYTSLRLLALPFLPFSMRKISILATFDRVLWRLFFKLFVRIYGFNKIVLTHPLLMDYVRGIDIEIIYDCHDDNAEFYPDGQLKDLISKKQEVTLKNVHRTIFSSKYLFDKFSINESDAVVRNGHNCSTSFLTAERDNFHPSKLDNYNVFYFGTISDWFDFDVLIRILDNIPSISFTIIGPSDIEVETHDRINYMGSIDHDKLIELAQFANAFIMPFKLNELILGVDPVKIYEYLSYPVPVISVYYPELRHFFEYVEFYSSYDELQDIFERLIDSADQYEVNSSARVDFLMASSWSSRALEFKEAIL